MEPAAAELQKQLSQFLSRLDEQKELLETQAAKWRNYQDDYNALEKQLQTLPDQTSRSAMASVQRQCNFAYFDLRASSW